MSDVKRYVWAREDGMDECREGDFVRHADYAKLEAEAQALSKEVAALRARVAVVPERKEWVPDGRVEGWNDCLDELSRLNGKAVSEGLLRSAYICITDLILSAQARPSCQKGIVEPCRCHRCNVERSLRVDAELRAMLGEGKEVGDA